MPAPALPAVELLVVAFAGGAFGAAVGALPSFAMAGLVVVLGELYDLAARSAGAATLPVDVTGTIAFGPVLGPHVAFGGGAAAAAYAARRGYLEDDGGSHPAKEITRGLGTRPDVLAVGGAFGVLGLLIAAGSRSLALPVDPVALGVVGSAIAHRIALGYAVLGVPTGSWLAVGPAVAQADGEGTDPSADSRAAPDGGTRRARPWLPYQYRWRDVAGVGLVVGVLAAYLAYVTASPFLAFGITVVPLALLCAGVDGVPVTHHVALPASTVVLAMVGAPAGALTPSLVAEAVSLSTALLLGAAAGVAGALLGELIERRCYAHAETHLDPPAASIVLTSGAIAALALVGVVPSAVWIPTP